jgi:hypothetical protein
MTTPSTYRTPRPGAPVMPGVPGMRQPGEQEQAAPVRPRKARPGFGLRGPRRDVHGLSARQLESMSLPLGDDGVVAGIDEGGNPAVLGFFRPTQLDVVVIGSVWTAQVLALRAVGTGARVAVESARPQVWTPLAQAAGGGQQCMTVHDVRQLPSQGPTVSSPVLVVRDCGTYPPRSRLAKAPWQAVVTLLPFLGPQAPRLLREAGLIGVQRVSPQEAEVLTKVLRLTREEAAALPALGDGVMLWGTPQHRQFVLLQPTDAEVGLLGEARRID